MLKLETADPEIDRLIAGEMTRQATGLELIASENYVSPAIMQIMGSVLNNRYSEGYPGAKYYGGQEFMNQIETLAIERAKDLFGCSFANVQPHSGSSANIATYLGLAEPGDCIMGMDLSHGGHLTHGHPVTHTAKLFNFSRYGMSDTTTGEIDYDQVLDTAKATRPKIIIAGFSAYSRELDYAKFRSICDEVGAWAVADVAHIAGMIVAGKLANPFHADFDVVLTTTHKSLRGPRGGLILARTPEIGKRINKSVFPSFQGGPIMQMVAAKATALKEAADPSFASYGEQILKNAKALEKRFAESGVTMLGGGTDNHLLLIDAVSSWGLSGNEAEQRLESIGITLNKNMIANDPRSALDPSGIRLGTPAMTTRGMTETDMTEVADIIDLTLRDNSAANLNKQRARVLERTAQFPVPGIPSAFFQAAQTQETPIRAEVTECT